MVLVVASSTLLVGAIAFLPLASSPVATPSTGQMHVATKLTSIPVEGMFCLSCAAAIKQKVKSLDGVRDAEVHFGEKIVVVNYAASHPEIPVRAAAAINSLGYKAGRPVTEL